MKGVKKQHLPDKTCEVCKLPFSWRRKWEKNWEQVKYCSERCRRNAKWVEAELIGSLVSNEGS